MKTLRPLTERQREVLKELAVAKSTVPQWNGWLTPMYCGGRDGSHHSATLTRLMHLGLVERERRAGWVRRSWLYRITPSGRRRLSFG